MRDPGLGRARACACPALSEADAAGSADRDLAAVLALRAGLLLGATEGDRPFAGWRDLWLIVLFGIGSVVMRGAGCTYNDIVDRGIDAQVARTRGRPIPSGGPSACAMRGLFLAAQCFVGLLVLVQLNLFAVELGAASLILVAAYRS